MKLLISAILILFFFEPKHLFSSEKSLIKKNLFASIKTTEAYLRYGPGKQFPIMWTFKRKHWPIKIIDKFNYWRKIKTIDKSVGWMHKTQISQKKTSMILKTDFLRKNPNLKSKRIYLIKKNVLVNLLNCKKYWCKVKAIKKNSHGWFIKHYLWGTD